MESTRFKSETMLRFFQSSSSEQDCGADWEVKQLRDEIRHQRKMQTNKNP